MLGVEYDRTGVNRSTLSSCKVQVTAEASLKRGASERHGAFDVMRYEELGAITEELF